MKQKDKTCKKRDSYDRNKGWYSSLKEIGYLLPISETAGGRGLTKKETLVHMLQYFDFLQSHIQSLQSRLPAHCIPQANDRESESESEDTPHSEPGTPPHILKCKYSSTRLCKRTTLHPDPFDAKKHNEDPERNVTVNVKKGYFPSDKSVCFIDDDDSNTQPDSNHSLNVLLSATSTSRTGSSVNQESPGQGSGSNCSVCEDRTGSEDGSQESKDLHTPPSGSFLLKDLNLSPSLLTSPSRGLSHPLLPNGEEELQTVFEDVGVTPKPPLLKVPSLPCNSPDDVDGNTGCVSSPSEEDDENWSPKLRRSVKTARKTHRRRSFNKRVLNPSLKKKCVNGFIMFCCMNRALYRRTHPHTPSTVVTKELASLWHIMPKQERRLYCLKARRYSQQQNRNVRSEDKDAEGEEEICIPSPLHMFLARRDLHFTSSGKN